jgi:signal transduction histidine kinase/CheY-like chemotaxis protein
MIRNLRDTTQKNTEQGWLKTNLAKFSRMLQGQKDLNAVGRLILSELAPVVDAQRAVFYVLESGREPPRLGLLASYGADGSGAAGRELALGEGLIGQCAIDKQKILLANVPADYIRIASGLGSAAPQNILVLPVIFEGQVKGVLELASFERFSPTHQAFLEQLTESIGIVINTIEANTRTENLLLQSQSLARELQSRQEELQQTNQELEEKAMLLAHQNQEVERKNQEVEQARKALEEKAEQLALTSKYKSEFLANMSHELRTPLNSLLILSDQLCKNPGGNLTGRQVDFAKTIHASGNDLLNLINDILDLSKIESGTVIVDPTDLLLDDLGRYVERTFRHVAEAKNVDFLLRLDPRLPKAMFADAKRLQQVLKNLLSNAFKFTHQGQVTLLVEPVKSGWDPGNESLNRASDVIAFSVIDTGIGISAEKQQIIFEAFQQADGSTSRKYGGTGLGLAISRELAQLLGGEIRLISTPRLGSTFTLYLPRNFVPVRAPRKSAQVRSSTDTTALAANADAAPVMPAKQSRDAGDYGGLARTSIARRDAVARMFNALDDDRDVAAIGDPVLIIVENDVTFARLVRDAAREKGFKAIATASGADAVALIAEFKPVAITLDISLPDIQGWRVLDRLKNDIATRHIPVAVISTDESRDRALDSGAYAFVAKPIQSKDVVDGLLERLRDYARRVERRVLAVSQDKATRDRFAEQLASDDIEVVTVADWSGVAATLRTETVDCVVLDAGLPAPTTEFLASRAAAGPAVPVLPIVVEGSPSWLGDLRIDADGAHNVIVRTARTPKEMVALISTFLHRVPAKMPEAHRLALREAGESRDVLTRRTVMVVDDDVRNIFALTSLLEDQGMLVVAHDNGRDALRSLEGRADIDAVLMDIMMPEMDGIDTIREIRKIRTMRDVPVIAVTAKAMKGDREKCMEAGAWDYLSKPVDPGLLIGVLRAWLAR